jgi:hypothetical protein
MANTTIRHMRRTDTGNRHMDIMENTSRRTQVRVRQLRLPRVRLRHPVEKPLQHLAVLLPPLDQVLPQPHPRPPQPRRSNATFS